MESNTVKAEYIDCLRGIAIIMVILTHVVLSTRGLNSNFYYVAAYGKMGVQLFFFLSAYTLCLSMSGRNDGVSAFYIRRYFRIAPIYYTGIFIYYFVFLYARSHPSPLPLFGSYNRGNVICNILLLHGLVPAANNTVVPGGWSIGTEILFYLLFPFLFNLYRTVTSKSIYWVIPLLAFVITYAAALTLLLCFNINVYRHDGFYYYSIINQLPVFLTGMSFYFLKPKFKQISSYLYLPLFCVLFGASFIISFHLNYDTVFFPFIASLSFIFLFLFFETRPVFNFKTLQKTGRLSFSVYIIHFIFCWLYAGLKFPINPYLSCFASLVINLVLSVTVAGFSQKFIEKPGIELGKLFIKKLNSPFSAKAV